ncbi:hypothetical protein COY07_03450 [Candidatus Peregrinibacteria bacterium CG_4_10_14_0_2_um_filter_43_11]|nr:MAG: hypothetical protein COY07_03450 [Candidatus Peregrinibacteria bacterium CG_4_10_14_0_2_um_filter_43_11]
MKFRRKVYHGSKIGRKIGFPTINLNIRHFDEHHGHGVYICRIAISGEHHNGLLYFGPKMNHPGNVLEIYIQNFHRTIYGQWISFEVGKKIRKAMTFKTTDSLKKQIQKDLEQGLIRI